MPNLAVYERNTKKKGMPNAESSHARLDVRKRTSMEETKKTENYHAFKKIGGYAIAVIKH